MNGEICLIVQQYPHLFSNSSYTPNLEAWEYDLIFIFIIYLNVYWIDLPHCAQPANGLFKEYYNNTIILTNICIYVNYKIRVFLFKYNKIILFVSILNRKTLEEIDFYDVWPLEIRYYKTFFFFFMIKLIYLFFQSKFLSFCN